MGGSWSGRVRHGGRYLAGFVSADPLAPTTDPVADPAADLVAAPVAEPAADESGGAAALAVVVYWRPGCPFCSMLRAGLRRHGVPFREVDIWADPDAAAFVRSVARGNETVPTVTVGDVALVNPSAGEVARLHGAARD